jgi:predicted NodU family carbamoyl transferase
MRILGLNALFHDPAAALVVDGMTVAAAEEERFSRHEHGKRPVPFSAWELPEQSTRRCLEHGGMRAEELDAVMYSFAEDGGAARVVFGSAPVDLRAIGRYAVRMGRALA